MLTNKRKYATCMAQSFVITNGVKLPNVVRPIYKMTFNDNKTVGSATKRLVL